MPFRAIFLGSVLYGGNHSPPPKKSLSSWIIESLPQLGWTIIDWSKTWIGEVKVEWMMAPLHMVDQSQVNTSRVHPCNATNLMDSAEMQFYLDATGDWDGVTREGGVLFRCFHYRSRWVWWLSPIHENIPAIFQVFRCCFSSEWFLQRLSREKCFWWWCAWIRWFS